MNFALIIALIAVLSVVNAFSPSTFKRISRPSTSLAVAGGSPGKNLKPNFDGEFVEAGAPLETYKLENDNGDKAVVDTKTGTCISWIKNGKEMISSKAMVHMFPTATTPLTPIFFPEERAKKVSFDRMIFKTHETIAGVEGVEYRVDVTLRAGSLEYDVVIVNLSPKEHQVSMGLVFNTNGAKITAMKGYTKQTENSVSTDSWTVPVGKFKETKFYAKLE